MDSVIIKAVSVNFTDHATPFYWEFKDQKDTHYVREVVRFEDNWIRISRQGESVAFPRERVKEVKIFS